MTSKDSEGAPRRRLLVTGATGFIGQAFVHRAAARGYQVTGLSRSGQSTAGMAAARRWALGDGLPAGLAPDIVVHLAHDFDGAAGAQTTIVGTMRLAGEAAKQGAYRQIFVSSYSAGPHAISRYGRTKYQIEQQMDRIAGRIIVRPGLVLGDAGIFGRIAAVARNSPVVPLPDGGRGHIPVIELELLASKLVDLCQNGTNRQAENLFHKDLPTLKQLVMMTAERHGRRPAVLAVPLSLALPTLRAIEFLKIRPPVSSDSLLGFVANQSAGHVSTLEE